MPGNNITIILILILLMAADGGIAGNRGDDGNEGMLFTRPPTGRFRLTYTDCGNVQE